ncbi:DENN domain-containing protein 2B-like isoform X2 [Pararge aegeria]|uniref:DENN domain-containing protein 2B-like isoform X2 n=1 Tax=Pararge aegeria TaxID=116150 RepID=UPI0019D0C15C|nr:DENN domain-containing protein 2B-like isoform X2 [Pararge aegeria]
METSRDQKIYDEPCEISRPPTPEIPKTEFQKLRQNFENASQKVKKLKEEKPLTQPLKPILSKKVWKSTENVSDDFRKAKRAVEKKFATETKRYKKNEAKMMFSLPKRDSQLDVDRENLNRLMTEIYETVTAACNMDENKPGSFPTDLTDTASEESVKLTRSLTEKRKNYVRRVSSRVAYLDKNVRSPRFRHQTSICSYKSDVIDNPYSTFRSWKSFRTSQSNLRDKMERHDSTDSKINLTDSSGNILSIQDVSDDSLDNLSIDEKAGCVGLELPFEPREKGLFNVCMLVGLNYMTGEAYVKSVFPSQVQVPPHIENLIFPETISSGNVGEWATEKTAQCYSLVLTDEKGERAYGYCRRVLPEGATTCLPLCYCLIGKYRAPGFYYKILQEIESHHGNSEVEINQILHQLFETDFPNPGEQISIMYTNTLSRSPNRYSISLGDIHKCKTMPDPRRNESTVNVSVTKESLTESPERSEKVDSELFIETESHALPEYYDLENNNHPKRVMLSLEGPRTRVIKRPLDPRADEDNMSVLLDSFGAGLVIKVFGSLLLERKVIVMGDQLNVISSCMEALQSCLYPFVWQQPLISAIPSEIQRDVLTAPLPILAGMLAHHHPSQFEEGMLIDLAHPSKVLFYQGDESTIVPTASYKTLKTSLQMESKTKPEDTRTRNVMISEAFLRFFVDILGDFWRFFSEREMKDGDLGKNGVVFDKEAFIKNASSKQVQYFLEWFTETAMFNHFIQNMALCYHDLPLPSDYINTDLVDTPLPNYYELFHERVKSRSKSEKSSNKIDYKNAVNKKVRLLKTKLRDLVT